MARGLSGAREGGEGGEDGDGGEGGWGEGEAERDGTEGAWLSGRMVWRTDQEVLTGCLVFDGVARPELWNWYCFGGGDVHCFVCEVQIYTSPASARTIGPLGYATAAWDDIYRLLRTRCWLSHGGSILGG